MVDRRDDPRDKGDVEPHRDLRGALHDVSNALTVLLGWIAEARAPGQAPAVVHTALEIAEQQGLLAKHMARRAIGDADSREEPKDGWAELAHHVVDRVKLALSLEASRRGVEIVVGDAPVIMIEHGDDLAQIITNLLLNALDHAPRGSVVRCTVDAVVRSDATCASIDVVDEGPGVPADREESIFAGDSARDGGTGTGLPYSREMTRARGGDLLFVRSREGAAFRVIWPRAGSPSPTSLSRQSIREASVPRAHVLANVSVIVLDDDPAITDLLETALSARGADVTVVCAKDELSAAVALRTFDVALVDLSPLRGDVEGGLRRLDGRVGRVVLITGSADSIPDSMQGPGGSIVDVVRKPFEVSEVISVVAAPRSR